ncbi:hypothetical protein HTSR_1210 [Halodesulfurarchaeum formicicum]|uniref:Uncharacterized protein n=1 Tax=Halodesulfurarchaeum formicicum TaxID=1873524 RepID=A0A1D8S4U6_9EURY|nr:hypothetical protein [Halodesulfurarchaeum formicicum]AOW80388.1 hypothetical protein HTSR_1210 [Halodesulfurarchaeum formicicum]
MDRGVSDLVGYVLIFALITSSVAVVTVGGYDSLGSVRDAERFENAQRVFDVLGANVDDHLESHVESRGTEIRLADARLGFGDPVTLNVTVEGVGSNQTTIDPLVYTQGADRQIAYTGGAVLRAQGGSALVTTGPPFRFGDEMVISMVNTRGRDPGIAGSGRVLVRTEATTRSTHAYTDGPYTVSVTVDDSYPDAWERWFKSETGENCTATGGTVTCDGVESVYVRTVAIDVYLE